MPSTRRAVDAPLLAIVLCATALGGVLEDRDEHAGPYGTYSRKRPRFRKPTAT
jgi:hypothetical protein